MIPEFEFGSGISVDTRELTALVVPFESTVFAGIVENEISTEFAVLYAAELNWLVLTHKNGVSLMPSSSSTIKLLLSLS